MFESFKQMSRETKIILFGVLLTGTSTFMLSPFLALYMNSKGFSASQIGIVLTSSLIFQQGLSFVGGIAGDRFGYKKTLIVGLIVRTAGYMIFVFSNQLLLLITASSFVGIGGSLITPSTKASIAATEDERGKAFALRNVAVNMGASLGPILGGLLYNTSFFIVFFLAAFTHITLLVLVIIFVKNFQGLKSNNIFVDFKKIITDLNIVRLTAITALFWLLYSQLNLSIPLYLKNQLHLESFTGTLFALNGILVIAFQYYLFALFEKKFTYTNILFYGMMFLAVSFAVISLIPNIAGLYFYIILFTVGEILIGPSIDNLASNMAPSPSCMGGYLGFVTMGWAIGGSIGNTLGGYLYNITSKNSLWLTWYFYAFLAVITAFLFKGLKTKAIGNKKTA